MWFPPEMQVTESSPRDSVGPQHLGGQQPLGQLAAREPRELGDEHNGARALEVRQPLPAELEQLRTRCVERDRKSVVEGKGGSVRLEHGGRRILQKTK